MRTTLLRAFMLGASACAAPAMAQDTDTLNVQSVVVPYCSQLSISSIPMNLGELTGPTGQLVSSFASSSESTRQISTNFYCNAPAKVTLRALPLVHSTVSVVGDAQSFTNRVDYTAKLTWNTIEGQVSSTAAADQEINAPQANIGGLELALSNPVVANNLRPIAGVYAGQVRLTVSLTQ